MTVTARAWASDEDLVRMQALMSRSWRAERPVLAGTPGDLEWWVSQEPEFDGSKLIRLWFDGDELVAWGWLQGSSMEWHGAPGLTAGAIHEEMLDWLEGEVAASPVAGESVATTTIWAMESERPLIALLERRGYGATDDVLTHWSARATRGSRSSPFPRGTGSGPSAGRTTSTRASRCTAPPSRRRA